MHIERFSIQLATAFYIIKKDVRRAQVKISVFMCTTTTYHGQDNSSNKKENSDDTSTGKKYKAKHDPRPKKDESAVHFKNTKNV